MLLFCESRTLPVKIMYRYWSTVLEYRYTVKFGERNQVWNCEMLLWKIYILFLHIAKFPCDTRSHSFVVLFFTTTGVWFVNRHYGTTMGLIHYRKIRNFARRRFPWIVALNRKMPSCHTECNIRQWISPVVEIAIVFGILNKAQTMIPERSLRRWLPLWA